MNALPPFPVGLETTFDTAVQALGPPVLDIQDCTPDEMLSDDTPPTRDWRHAKFSTMRDTHSGFVVSASCNVFIGYRPSSRAIWRVTVTDASRTLRAALHGIPVNGNLREVIKILGLPFARVKASLGNIIDEVWWKTPDVSYHLRVFRQPYHGLTGHLDEGAIQEIRVFSIPLAPFWEPGLKVLCCERDA